MPRPKRRARRTNRGRVLLVAAAIALFVLITSLRGIASFYTDFLWFDSLGQSHVFTGVLGAKVALALIFTGTFFVLLWANLLIADRLAPRFRPAGPEEELIERYHELVGQRTGLVRIGVALLFALIAGPAASSNWNEWLLFTNRVDFGVKDELFHRDVGFYVFQLPFLTFVVSWLLAAFVIVLVVTAVAHYLNGGIRVQTPFQRVTPQVKAHLSVLLALLALIKTAGYYLQQFELTTSSRGTVDGATYTDVKVQLPAVRLLLLISLLAFVLFIVNIRRRGWVLPVLAVGLWAFVAAVAGGIVPALVQRFQVEPSESSKERPYIERNIEATRAAMGLGDVETQEFTEDDRLRRLTAADVSANAETVNNIRLWDPSSSITGQTFRQLQEIRGFYDIRDVDVDRYEIDGTLRQVMVSARELNTADVPQRSWEARHLAFTHGYGVVMAPANFKDEEDQPAFAIRDVPLNNQTDIDIDQPGLYIGEGQGGYVIVNTRREEIDYEDNEGDNVHTAYEGGDGVDIGSWFRRAAFAARFWDFNPIFSNNLRGDSRILILRDVRERLGKLAPFLSYDADPYAVVDEGRVKWVVDAYTTTDRYPYAQRARTDRLPDGSGLNHRFNYVRNSVKAVVDAYDGTVDLYVIDEDDAIASAYRKAFPSLFADGPPPESLRAHFRYPEDLFHVQTDTWGRYHVTDPDAFYNNNGGWDIAQDPGTSRVSTTTTVAGQGTTVSATANDRIAPVYVLMRLPGEQEQSFVMLRPFVPLGREGGEGRQQLTAFMAASSDPEDYGRLTTYTMPTGDLPAGPVIAGAAMSADPDVAELETLLGIEGGGSEIRFGNLLLIPIEDSILYVRPVYVEAEQNPIPLLRKVIVEHQGNVAVQNSLREALEDLFGPLSDEIEGDLVPGAHEPTEPEDDIDPEVRAAQLLAEARDDFVGADAALREGDLAEYERRIESAEENVRQAQELLAGGAGAAGSETGGSGSGTSESTTTTADTEA
jgi:hypothetical protein